MSDLITRVEFWIAMIMGAILKFKASPPTTPFSALTSIVAGICAAVILTDPIAGWLGFEGDKIRYAIAGLVMLTCEHFSRELLGMKLADFIPKGWKK